jgi:hypothetical protein
LGAHQVEEHMKNEDRSQPRELTSEELDVVSGGAVLVIGNQDEPGDQSYHSADATYNNPNARRFWVVTHNWGGLDNGPIGTLPGGT